MRAAAPRAHPAQPHPGEWLATAERQDGHAQPFPCIDKGVAAAAATLE
jgi:hypothetical protein